MDSPVNGFFRFRLWFLVISLSLLFIVHLSIDRGYAVPWSRVKVISIVLSKPGLQKEAVLSSIISPVEQLLKKHFPADTIAGSAWSGRGRILLYISPRNLRINSENLIRNLIQENISQFPEETRINQVRELLSETDRADYICFLPDKRKLHDRQKYLGELNKFTEEIILPHLKRRFPSIKISQAGGVRSTVAIELKEKAIRNYGITPQNVKQQLQQQYFEKDIGTENIHGKRYQISIRSNSDHFSDIKNAPIVSQDGKHRFPLGEISRVSSASEYSENRVFLDGKETIALQVKTDNGLFAGHKTRLVYREVDSLLESLPFTGRLSLVSPGTEKTNIQNIQLIFLAAAGAFLLFSSRGERVLYLAGLSVSFALSLLVFNGIDIFFLAGILIGHAFILLRRRSQDFSGQHDAFYFTSKFFPGDISAGCILAFAVFLIAPNSLQSILLRTGTPLIALSLGFLCYSIIRRVFKLYCCAHTRGVLGSFRTLSTYYIYFIFVLMIFFLFSIPNITKNNEYYAYLPGEVSLPDLFNRNPDSVPHFCIYRSREDILFPNCYIHEGQWQDNNAFSRKNDFFVSEFNFFELIASGKLRFIGGIKESEILSRNDRFFYPSIKQAHIEIQERENTAAYLNQSPSRIIKLATEAFHSTEKFSLSGFDTSMSVVTPFDPNLPGCEKRHGLLNTLGTGTSVSRISTIRIGKEYRELFRIDGKGGFLTHAFQEDDALNTISKNVLLDSFYKFCLWFLSALLILTIIHERFICQFFLLVSVTAVLFFVECAFMSLFLSGAVFSRVMFEFTENSIYILPLLVETTRYFLYIRVYRI